MANTAKKTERKGLTLQRYDGRKWVEDRTVVISEEDATVFNLDAAKRGQRYVDDKENVIGAKK